MTRTFNTAGPNIAERHYTLPALDRLPDVMGLVAASAWFVLHAPRQTGKTTAMRALAAELVASGDYAALVASCEAGEPFSSDPAAVERIVCHDIRRAASLNLPPALRPPAADVDPVPGQLLADLLHAWCAACPRPVVLLLDEIDALRGDALVTVLRQLRSLYPHRPAGAPSTVALIGLRDVRDYKVVRPEDSVERLGTSSPFNVKVESLTLASFGRVEVAALYAQHQRQTGQAFSADAIDRVMELTCGQPWLVSALGRELIDKMKVEGDIDVSHVNVAKERLILARQTHLDSLADKLREPRVRAVVAPLLTGEQSAQPTAADVEYCVDLGLVAQPHGGALAIANPIYREVLPRELTVAASYAMPQTEAMGPPRRWALADGTLDLDGILAAFCDFWRQHGEWMVRGQQWPEFAHQIVLMAFLQRLINGGGTIEREYGLGRRRLDLLIRWNVRVDRYGATLQEDRHALELKVWRDGARDPLAEGLEQLDGYLARLGLDRGVLVLFDARSASPSSDDWAERIAMSEAQTASRRSVCVLRV